MSLRKFISEALATFLVLFAHGACAAIAGTRGPWSTSAALMAGVGVLFVAAELMPAAGGDEPIRIPTSLPRIAYLACLGLACLTLPFVFSALAGAVIPAWTGIGFGAVSGSVATSLSMRAFGKEARQ